MSKQKQKELLSVMIAKTVLAIAIITGLGTIIIGGGVVIMKYYSDEVNNRIVETVDQETDYQKLAKDCEKFKKSKFITDYDCCMQTVEIMQKGNFKLAPKSGCSEGFQINSLWCGGAYQWCEPMEENCAKEGESVGTRVGGIGKCCQGLKSMVNLKYNGECVNLPAPGSGGVCSNCGNGICDKQNNEDECNCPEDCGDNALLNCCDLECEKYRYGTCPEGCTKACVGSCPECDDCGGEGSCYCPEDCGGENRCSLTPEGGPCKAIIVKYYFDQEEEKCKEFNWGGCGGVVPFETMEDCKKECEEEIDQKFYCEKDNDCEVNFSNCDCQYHCVNKDIEIGDCDNFCYAIPTTVPECVCENNKCIDEKLSTSDWQTYRNEEFGFEVKYPKNDGLSKYKIKQIGNTFYIAFSDCKDVKDGQLVTIFAKDSEDSLKQAIEKKFLKNFSKEDCFVNERNISYLYKYPENYIVLSAIDYPEEKKYPLENKNNCPYAIYNGKSYFLMDSNHPDKFVYFSIGQYSIPAALEGVEIFWQDTFKFIES